MHIQWGPIYQVHIKIIDEQHKKTVDLFNTLNDVAEAALIGSDEVAITNSLVEEIVAHLKFHIGTEEHYFDEFQYEHAQEHKKAHREFISGVGNVLAMYKDDPNKMATNLIP